MVADGQDIPAKDRICERWNFWLTFHALMPDAAEGAPVANSCEIPDLPPTGPALAAAGAKVEAASAIPAVASTDTMPTMGI